MMNPLTDFLELFHEMPAADKALISDATEQRFYKEGEQLSQSGKISREIFFIVRGVLRIMAVNDKGKEVTHFFLKENQFCTILNSFNNHVPASETIEAACYAEVLALSRQGLDKLYTQVPYLQTLITGITHQALLDKINIRNTYLGQDSATRYKTFVMRQPEIAMRVSLSNIASYLCITPQSLSRIRKNVG
jgi:CRP-like cAMP-binding protein